jgi:hypothetical protein
VVKAVCWGWVLKCSSRRASRVHRMSRVKVGRHNSANASYELQDKKVGHLLSCTGDSSWSLTAHDVVYGWKTSFVSCEDMVSTLTGLRKYNLNKLQESWQNNHMSMCESSPLSGQRRMSEGECGERDHTNNASTEFFNQVWLYDNTKSCQNGSDRQHSKVGNLDILQKLNVRLRSLKKGSVDTFKRDIAVSLKNSLLVFYAWGHILFVSRARGDVFRLDHCIALQSVSRCDSISYLNDKTGETSVSMCVRNVNGSMHHLQHLPISMAHGLSNNLLSDNCPMSHKLDFGSTCVQGGNLFGYREFTQEFEISSRQPPLFPIPCPSSEVVHMPGFDELRELKACLHTHKNSSGSQDNPIKKSGTSGVPNVCNTASVYNYLRSVPAFMAIEERTVHVYQSCSTTRKFTSSLPCETVIMSLIGCMKLKTTDSSLLTGCSDPPKACFKFDSCKFASVNPHQLILITSLRVAYNTPHGAQHSVFFEDLVNASICTKCSWAQLSRWGGRKPRGLHSKYADPKLQYCVRLHLKDGTNVCLNVRTAAAMQFVRRTCLRAIDVRSFSRPLKTSLGLLTDQLQTVCLVDHILQNGLLAIDDPVSNSVCFQTTQQGAQNAPMCKQLNIVLANLRSLVDRHEDCSFDGLVLHEELLSCFDHSKDALSCTLSNSLFPWCIDHFSLLRIVVALLLRGSLVLTRPSAASGRVTKNQLSETEFDIVADGILNGSIDPFEVSLHYMFGKIVKNVATSPRNRRVNSPPPTQILQPHSEASSSRYTSATSGKSQSDCMTVLRHLLRRKFDYVFETSDGVYENLWKRTVLYWLGVTGIVNDVATARVVFDSVLSNVYGEFPQRWFHPHNGALDTTQPETDHDHSHNSVASPWCPDLLDSSFRIVSRLSTKGGVPLVLCLVPRKLRLFHCEKGGTAIHHLLVSGPSSGLWDYDVGLLPLTTARSSTGTIYRWKKSSFKNNNLVPILPEGVEDILQDHWFMNWWWYLQGSYLQRFSKNEPVSEEVLVGGNTIHHLRVLGTCCGFGDCERESLNQWANNDGQRIDVCGGENIAYTNPFVNLMPELTLCDADVFTTASRAQMPLTVFVAQRDIVNDKSVSDLAGMWFVSQEHSLIKNHEHVERGCVSSKSMSEPSTDSRSRCLFQSEAELISGDNQNQGAQIENNSGFYFKSTPASTSPPTTVSTPSSRETEFTFESPSVANDRIESGVDLVPEYDIKPELDSVAQVASSHVRKLNHESEYEAACGLGAQSRLVARPEDGTENGSKSEHLGCNVCGERHSGSTCGRGLRSNRIPGNTAVNRETNPILEVRWVDCTFPVQLGVLLGESDETIPAPWINRRVYTNLDVWTVDPNTLQKGKWFLFGHTMSCVNGVRCSRSPVDNNSHNNSQPTRVQTLLVRICDERGPPASKPFHRAALAPPIRFKLEWSCTNSVSGATTYMWSPIAPPGYLTLGTIITVDSTPPSVGFTRCIRRDLMTALQTKSRNAYLTLLESFDFVPKTAGDCPSLLGGNIRMRRFRSFLDWNDHSGGNFPWNFASICSLKSFPTLSKTGVDSKLTYNVRPLRTLQHNRDLVASVRISVVATTEGVHVTVNETHLALSLQCCDGIGVKVKVRPKTVAVATSGRTKYNPWALSTDPSNKFSFSFVKNGMASLHVLEFWLTLRGEWSSVPRSKCILAQGHFTIFDLQDHENVDMDVDCKQWSGWLCFPRSGCASALDSSVTPDKTEASTHLRGDEHHNHLGTKQDTLLTDLDTTFRNGFSDEHNPRFLSAQQLPDALGCEVHLKNDNEVLQSKRTKTSWWKGDAPVIFSAFAKRDQRKRPKSVVFGSAAAFSGNTRFQQDMAVREVTVWKNCVSGSFHICEGHLLCSNHAQSCVCVAGKGCNVMNGVPERRMLASTSLYLLEQVPYLLLRATLKLANIEWTGKVTEQEFLHWWQSEGCQETIARLGTSNFISTTGIDLNDSDPVHEGNTTTFASPTHTQCSTSTQKGAKFSKLEKPSLQFLLHAWSSGIEVDVASFYNNNNSEMVIKIDTPREADKLHSDEESNCSGYDQLFSDIDADLLNVSYILDTHTHPICTSNHSVDQELVEKIRVILGKYSYWVIAWLFQCILMLVSRLLQIPKSTLEDSAFRTVKSLDICGMQDTKKEVKSTYFFTSLHRIWGVLKSVGDELIFDKTMQHMMDSFEKHTHLKFLGVHFPGLVSVTFQELQAKQNVLDGEFTIPGLWWSSESLGQNMSFADNDECKRENSTSFENHWPTLVTLTCTSVVGVVNSAVDLLHSFHQQTTVWGEVHFAPELSPPEKHLGGSDFQAGVCETHALSLISLLMSVHTLCVPSGGGWSRLSSTLVGSEVPTNILSLLTTLTTYQKLVNCINTYHCENSVQLDGDVVVVKGFAIKTILAHVLSEADKTINELVSMYQKCMLECMYDWVIGHERLHRFKWMLGAGVTVVCCRATGRETLTTTSPTDFFTLLHFDFDRIQPIISLLDINVKGSLVEMYYRLIEIHCNQTTDAFRAQLTHLFFLNGAMTPSANVSHATKKDIRCCRGESSVTKILQTVASNMQSWLQHLQARTNDLDSYECCMDELQSRLHSSLNTTTVSSTSSVASATLQLPKFEVMHDRCLEIMYDCSTSILTLISAYAALSLESVVQSNPCLKVCDLGQKIVDVMQQHTSELARPMFQQKCLELVWPRLTCAIIKTIPARFKTTSSFRHFAQEMADLSLICVDAWGTPCLEESADSLHLLCSALLRKIGKLMICSPRTFDSRVVGIESTLCAIVGKFTTNPTNIQAPFQGSLVQNITDILVFVRKVRNLSECECSGCSITTSQPTWMLRLETTLHSVVSQKQNEPVSNVVDWKCLNNVRKLERNKTNLHAANCLTEPVFHRGGVPLPQILTVEVSESLHSSMNHHDTCSLGKFLKKSPTIVVSTFELITDLQSMENPEGAFLHEQVVLSTLQNSSLKKKKDLQHTSLLFHTCRHQAVFGGRIVIRFDMVANGNVNTKFLGCALLEMATVHRARFLDSNIRMEPETGSETSCTLTSKIYLPNKINCSRVYKYPTRTNPNFFVFDKNMMKNTDVSLSLNIWVYRPFQTSQDNLLTLGEIQSFI